MVGRRFLICGLAAVSGAGFAQSQISETGRGFVYEAAFFQTYSPANALQIIEHVPGFTLDEGDNDVRGFRQAAGNVVINSRRPSSKSEALSTVLARIPATRVVRVELRSGERFGADYAGRALVANVILSDAGGTAGTAEATVRREYTGGLLPEGSISALIQRGLSTFNLSLSIKNRETSDRGYDLVTELPSGAEEELRIKSTHFRNPLPNASLTWGLEDGEQRSVHLNASLKMNYENLSQSSVVFPVGAVQSNDALYQRYMTRTVEFGGDVTRPLWGGGLKLVGLANRRLRDRDDEALMASIAGESLGGAVQHQRDWRDETLARLAWNGSAASGWTAEFGVEGSLNRLDGSADLFDIDGAGQALKVDLPVDDALVVEDRAEAFGTVGRTISNGLRIDIGLAYEVSRLTVTGDVGAKRSLRFLKPKASLDWRNHGWHAQISAERTVAQLNFEDFVSAAELAADRVNSGNPELQPERAWKFLLSVDRPVMGDGRIKFDVGYDFISMVRDRVPTVEGFDAPGNLPHGSSFSAVGNVDVPLTRMGVKGGRLSLYGSYVDTSVRDPYTLTQRPFSGIALFYYEARFRQDLGQFAWGASLVGSTGSDSYRRTEVDFYRGISPNVSAFVEYRPSARWTLTMGGSNLLDGSMMRERTFYSPDRTNPIPYALETRFRESHIVGYVTIKRSFD